ncbi:MAG TPA: BTAD domain-containing putative transcriptional regulator [Gaiellaceae bacterium]
MRFGILGPLEAVEGQRPIPLRGRNQRAVLALLLLNANDVVARERLIEELWGETPPDTAAKIVQNAVSQLRKLLPPDLLVTRAPGYLLRVDPEELDAARFERLVEEGRSAIAAGEHERAAALLREALDLWRGVALADFVYEGFAQAEIARLEELRLAAIEDRIDVDLALGRHAELVGELDAHVTRHPLRERLRGQLMLALYRAGRQAEALEVYQDTRRRLIDELGIEPSPVLQRLEKTILLHDPALESAPQPQAPARPAAPPRQVRKTVTLVFVELSGADPEALAVPIAAIRATLERAGATVEDLATGGVMAVFGVPVVHEDDALRALRAAIELRDAAFTDGGPAVRAGVSTGEVLAGGAGRTVVGEPVAAAARLAQAAAPGEILVGESTEQLVRSLAQLAPRRGSWRLESVREGATPIPRRLDAAMLGRERELLALRHAFDRAIRERTAYLFTVLGPAGIGKSRLAYEFTSQVGVEATVLAGSCLPYGEGITFWPLVQIVRTLAGDNPRETLPRLLGGDEEARLVAERVADAVGEVERPSGGDDLQWAVRRMLEAVARERPLVLVLEDVHWAQATFLDLLDHVADWTRDAPILLLCLARPELFDERPAWAGGKLNATSILLEPLSRSDAHTLIESLPGAAQLEEDVRQRIADAAEGNPLFLEQMLAMVAEEGGDVAVPPNIQALIAARLDRSDPAERAVLERASVVGKEFWRGAVVELSPPPERPAVAAQLQRLVRRDLIRPAPSIFPGDDGFRFSHLLIRDAAYASLTKHDRSGLHERFADWVEQRAGVESDVEEIIGYHLEQAHRYRVELGEPHDAALAARAADRLARAGRRAYARGDLPAAVSLLTRAAGLLAADAEERPTLLADLAEALRETGDFRGAEAVLADVRAAAAAAGDDELAAYALVIGLRLRLQIDPGIKTDELEREAKRAIEIFAAHGSEERLGKAWELLAWARWFRGRAAAAEEALQRALEHARAAGDSRTEAQAANLLMGAAFFGPMPADEAIRLCRATLARPEEQRRIKGSALRALAGLEAMRGDFAEARELVARYREILEDLGVTVTAASASETWAIVELLAGKPAAAERELRRGFASLERIGETFSQPNLAAMLADALHAQGRWEEALTYTEISEAGAGPEDVYTQAQWRSIRAKVLAALGRVAEAEALAREAVETAETTDFPVLRADSLADLAEVAQAAGRGEEAAAALRQAIELYEEKGNIVSARRAREALTEIEPAA